MAIKKNIQINSSDRTTGTSSNFIIKLGRRNTETCLSYYVSSVVLPFSYYVVNSNNNQLVWLYGVNSTSTISIVSGNYSYSELVTTIQTSLNAISAGAWTISYSVNTGLFTFSTPIATAFGMDATGSTSILSNLMGFTSSVYARSTSNVVSTNVADLTGPKYVYVKSTQLAYSEAFTMSTNTNDKGIILAIPVSVNPFDVIVYKDYNDINVIPFNKIFPDIFDIRLTDKNNVDINLNGVEWQFEIVLILEDIPKSR